MTAADFAANLWLEMCKTGSSLPDLARRIGGWSRTPEERNCFGIKASDRLWSMVKGKCDDPTAAEISDLATALNCPVERLTVSREELERRLEAYAETSQYEEQLESELAQERDVNEALRARVAELEAEKEAMRCKCCEKPFGERAGGWWRTEQGELYCPFCEKEAAE